MMVTMIKVAIKIICVDHDDLMIMMMMMMMVVMTNTQNQHSNNDNNHNGNDVDYVQEPLSSFLAISDISELGHISHSQ